METIETFRYLMSRANDIYNNRIEKVLREMDSVMLYTLPTNEAWTLDRFLDEIKGTCTEAANDLHRSSVMIEDAVEDLISLAMQSLNMHDQDNEDGADGSAGGSGIGSPTESGDEGTSRLPKAAIAFFKRTKKHDSASSSVIGGGGDSNLLHVVDKNSQVCPPSRALFLIHFQFTLF